MGEEREYNAIITMVMFFVILHKICEFITSSSMDCMDALYQECWKLFGQCRTDCCKYMHLLDPVSNHWSLAIIWQVRKGESKCGTRTIFGFPFPEFDLA